MGAIETIIVDSDGLIALFHEADVHAQKAIQILEYLSEKGVHILYPATVITETTALFQRRLKQPKLAAKIAQLITDNQLEIIPVDHETISAALAYFKPEAGSSHNTLFDAIVAAIAKKYKAKTVFSFDGWYKSVGLQLAVDIYASNLELS
jgi:predicted nucleic acid-binding protein